MPGTGTRDAEGSGPRRPRLLVVDDEPTVLAAIARLLRAEFEVVTQQDPRGALRAIECGEHYDAVLCDLTMPALDGQALYEAAIRACPALAPRFVFVTGGIFTERLREFARLEAHRVLEKPFDLDGLRAAVRRAAQG